MASMLCNACTYGSYEGYCGLGKMVVAGACSGYIEGQQPVPRDPLPWWDRPAPIDRCRGRGCQVLPFTFSDSGGSGYTMFLDYTQDRQVVTILRLLADYDWVFNALRQCRWYTAYGKRYTYPLSRAPARASVQVIPTWGMHKVMVHVRLVLTSLVPGNSSCQADRSSEVPEQLWWLDPTLPGDMVHPMHQLLSIIVGRWDTFCKSMSPRGSLYIDMDASASVLEEVLDVGLRLRGRPLTEWSDALDNLLGRR